MKYILGTLLLIIGIYLMRKAWRINRLPDIEDVETGHVEPEKPWPRSNLPKNEILKYINK